MKLPDADQTEGPDDSLYINTGHMKFSFFSFLSSFNW